MFSENATRAKVTQGFLPRGIIASWTGNMAENEGVRSPRRFNPVRPGPFSPTRESRVNPRSRVKESPGHWVVVPFRNMRARIVPRLRSEVTEIPSLLKR